MALEGNLEREGSPGLEASVNRLSLAQYEWVFQSPETEKGGRKRLISFRGDMNKIRRHRLSCVSSRSVVGVEL